jgi:hypothetical protein
LVELITATPAGSCHAARAHCPSPSVRMPRITATSRKTLAKS